MEFTGSMTALVTPFKDGKVDENALRGLVKRQIEGGSLRHRAGGHDRRVADAERG